MARTNKLIAVAKKLNPVIYAEYKQLIADNVISLINSGLSVAAACKKLDIERANVSHWAAENEEFAQHLAYARAEAAYYLAENCVEVAKDENIDPHRAKNIIAAQQWLASKYNPRQFGDKQQVEIKHSKHESFLDGLILPNYLKPAITLEADKT